MKRAKRNERRSVEALVVDVALPRQVGEVLKARGMMLATAESCTGGGIAQAVTRVSGSSAWFERGFVTYSNEAKEEMLGVSPDTMERQGAVSEATVQEMAQGALQYSRADVALSVSGVAGPTGGTPEKPVGTVWFAWATNDTMQTACHHLSGDRDAIREKSIRISLEGLLKLLGSEQAI
jgi:nicotinamide-nucleotide amidase